MKVKTSCEIATIAAIRYFSTRPDDALAFIKEIYDLAYIDALLDKEKSELQQPIPACAKKPRKAAESQGSKKPGKRAVIPGRRGPNRIELKRTEDARTMDERMEEAYLGERPNIEPEEKPVKKQPLTPAEKRLYDYMAAHPDHTKPQIQEALL